MVNVSEYQIKFSTVKTIDINNMLLIDFLVINTYKSFVKNNLRRFIETPNISGEFLPSSMEFILNSKKNKIHISSRGSETCLAVDAICI